MTLPIATRPPAPTESTELQVRMRWVEPRFRYTRRLKLYVSPCARTFRNTSWRPVLDPEGRFLLELIES